MKASPNFGKQKAIQTNIQISEVLSQISQDHENFKWNLKNKNTLG